MTIQVEDEQKVLLAKFGANKLFGDDPDKRQKEMNKDDLIKLFDQIWDSTLKRSVITAEVCDAKEAYDRLSTQEQKKYFDFKQQHRQFRLKDLNIEFIAQLNSISHANWTLTQLWRVASTDTNPKTLYVTFESVEQRKQFAAIASNLGKTDETLGLQLIMDFAAKFPETFSAPLGERNRKQ